MAGTAPLPPAERAGPAPWSGRAGVPPPRPSQYADQPGAEWYGEEQSERRWWLPIMLGTIALLLLGVLGVGLWLIIDADGGEEPGEAPRAPVTSAPATSRAPSSASPTTAAPTTPSTPATTAPTTPAVTTTAPAAAIPMPPLVGLPRAAASAVLDRLGLGHRIELQESLLPAGTVIGTDPRPGQPVRPGDAITLTVAEARPRPTAVPGGPRPG